MVDHELRRKAEVAIRLLGGDGDIGYGQDHPFGDGGRTVSSGSFGRARRWRGQGILPRGAGNGRAMVCRTANPKDCKPGKAPAPQHSYTGRQ